MSEKPAELTPQQKNVLQFVIDEISRTGTTPTVREIGRYIEMTHYNGAFKHLEALEEKGYIKRAGDHNNPRRIIPLRRTDGSPWMLDIQGAIRILKKLHAETDDSRIKRALEKLGF